MLAFEVSINGKRRYVAGHADAQMMYVIVSANRHAHGAGVSAFIAIPHANSGGSATLSYQNDFLSLGDEITLRVVDVVTADPPVRISTGDGSVVIEASND
jgi:hypothetical protein